MGAGDIQHARELEISWEHGLPEDAPDTEAGQGRHSWEIEAIFRWSGYPDHRPGADRVQHTIRASQNHLMGWACRRPEAGVLA